MRSRSGPPRSSTPPPSRATTGRRRIPFDDFDTNAVGTLNLLEAARQACPESPFVYMSTNKVYGDAPNRIALKELATRWDYADPAYANGISETFTDRPVEAFALRRLQGRGRRDGPGVRPLLRHADLLPARGLPDRARTTPGVELHGFLSYLVKCNLEGREYKVFGYKGKQVRDNIHSLDVARFIAAFVAAPRGRRGLQPRRRQGQQHLDPRGLQARGVLHREGAGVHLRGPEPDRRPHLLLLRPAEDPQRTIPKWDITQSLAETVRQIVESWRRRPRV